MKIYITKSLDNGVCISSIRTEDFSCLDSELMAEFGEPEVDAGGLFSTGSKATVTGSANLSAGYNFATASPSFSLAYCGAASHLVTLNADCANLAAVVAHIQTQVNSVFGTGVFAITSSGNYVVISTVSAGVSYSFVATSGSPDALAILGITTGTPHAGSGDDDFTLASDLVRIKSDSPYNQKFDSRDSSLARAKYMADTWAAALVVRIEAAMDALRANSDTFTTESMITY